MKPAHLRESLLRHRKLRFAFRLIRFHNDGLTGLGKKRFALYAHVIRVTPISDTRTGLPISRIHTKGVILTSPDIPPVCGADRASMPSAMCPQSLWQVRSSLHPSRAGRGQPPASISPTAKDARITANFSTFILTSVINSKAPKYCVLPRRCALDRARLMLPSSLTKGIKMGNFTSSTLQAGLW